MTFKTTTLKRNVWVLAVLAPLAAVAGAQTAGEVVAKNMEARGGAERWSRVKTLKLTGAFNRNGRESHLTVWYQQPEKIRLEIDFRGRKELFLYVGGRGWGQELRAEELRELEPEELAEGLDQVDFYAPWIDFWQRFATVELVGRVSIDSGPAYHLRVKPGSGRPVQDWYLDAASLHVVRTTQRGGGESEYSTYHYDHREYEGLSFASYVEVDFGTGMYSLTVESVEVDGELDQGLFEPPL